MENRTNEQFTDEVYEPPVLVEVGEFSEDTLGLGARGYDAVGQFG
jgi:hypothetical protein